MIDNSEKFNGGKTGLVEQEILRQIDIGNFRRNSLLPSERELAKQLGVSYMTVRRAIGKLVDDSFLTRVQGKGTYVRGDVPLHRMQQTLGIVVPAWETPEHADLMMILTAIAGENGVLPKFHLCRSWEDRTVVDAYESCDYLLLVPPAPLADLPEEMLVRFRAGTTPVVVLGLDATPYGLDSVTGDACTEAGIRELRRLGHCRIGLMTQVEERGGKLFRQTETFYRNWRLRMLEQFSAKEVDRMEIRIPVKAYELPHQAFYDYLYVNGKDLPFTALMLPLAVAWGVISAAADSGLAVPQKLSILSIGDRQEARFYRPRLSLVRVSYRRHAELALEALRRRMQEPGLPPRCFTVEPELVPGETVSPLLPPDNL